MFAGFVSIPLLKYTAYCKRNDFTIQSINRVAATATQLRENG